MEDGLNLVDENDVENLYDNIKGLIEESRKRVYRTVNTEMVQLYWNIGKAIVEKQDGLKRAKYGDYLIESISDKLSSEFGKGFSTRNIKRMRKFYQCYPIGTTLLSQLTWSHYLELIKIEDENKRNFYMHECINSNWGVRELQREKDSLLYERLIISNGERKVVELANDGIKLNEPKDIIKDPFVLEFLDIKDNNEYLESDLEKNILNHLKEFLLELGKGFTYVGNQVRITLGNEHFYPDMVLYNRILKCFVIVDLKIGKVTHQDIGQMQMYVNYYDRDIKDKDENKTIGILLSTDKNETIVKYTLPMDNETIFSTQYRLTIPNEEELKDIVEEEKKNIKLIGNNY